jgi:hypothetical protein
VTRAHYRPETDGFAFVNSWTFDATETAILTGLVTDAVDVIAVALSPLILAAEAPVLAIEGAVPFIGPWLVYKTIQAEINGIVNGIVGAITAKPYGLCGGMAFASLDYWRKSWVVPRGIGPNDQPQRTSPTGTALRNYIWTRLLDSVKNNVGTFLEWMAILHFDGSGVTALRDKTKTEIAKLKSHINSGMPVTVGLIGTTWNPLENHQVLVYGFDDNMDGTVTLFAYDNNAPGVETTYKMNFSGSALEVAESQDPGSRGPMRGLFCTAYTSATPPRTVVLSKGLAVLPKVTGLGDPVGVQASATNIGFHASPAVALVIAGDAGVPVKEVSPVPIAEGAARTLTGDLFFQSQGNRKIGVVASLGTFAGVAITKFLPAADANETSTGSVIIVGQRLIDADLETTCQIPNVVGGLANFSVRVDDMGSGLTYAWKATGAVITGGATSNQVSVQLPAQAGASVTLSVLVTRPDGGFSSGNYTFVTITPMAADMEHVLCEISHILTKAPFQTSPGDPGPDGGRVLNPGDLATLAGVAAQLSRAADGAAKAGAAITLSNIGQVRVPAPAATVAAATLAARPVPARPVIAGVAERSPVS